MVSLSFGVIRFSVPRTLRLFARPEILLLGVVASVGLLVHNVVWTSVFAIVATVCAVSANFVKTRNVDAATVSVIATSAVGVTIGFVVWRTAFMAPAQVLGPAVLLGALAVVIWRFVISRQELDRVVRYITSAVLVAVMGLVGWSAMTVDELRIDVIEVHRVAAENLADGVNPYQELGVVDTSPLAPDGAVYDSFPYPPSTLIVFTSAERFLGDARWATTIAGAVVVMLICAPWVRESGLRAAARVALATLFVALPLLGSFIRSGFTDLIALPLFFLSVMLLRTHRVAAWVLSGLALSTKAYFVLAIPLLLLWPGRDRWRRVLVVAAAALATFIPFLLWDYGSAINILSPGQVASPFRADSLGLTGLGIRVPRWLSYTAALSLVVVVGRRGGSSFRFLVALTGALLVVFLTGSQAFFNYWMLVAGLAIIALVSCLGFASGGAAEGAGAKDADFRDTEATSGQGFVRRGENNPKPRPLRSTRAGSVRCGRLRLPARSTESRCQALL